MLFSTCPARAEQNWLEAWGSAVGHRYDDDYAPIPDESITNFTVPKGTPLVLVNWVAHQDGSCWHFGFPEINCAKRMSIKVTVGSQQFTVIDEVVDHIESPPWEIYDYPDHWRMHDQVIDVSALTAAGNQPATLTVRAEAAGIWWFYPFWVQANAKADVELKLTTPDATVRPLNSEERDISGCPDHNTHSGCYWHYEMTMTPDTIKGRIKFELLDTSSLLGHSTNMCFSSDCTDAKDSGKDFHFEGQKQVQQIFDAPTDQGQTIQTTSDQVNSAKVVVASRDYGGKAWIRATFTIDGDDFSLTDSLPMDDDEDGIADSWEVENGGDLERDADSEPGKPGGSMPSPAGDGITAFDEYRGFHILDPTDLEGVKHVRTDPLTKQTVFYWDSNSPQFHNALQRILVPRTSSFAEYFPVNQQQAHTTSTTSLENPVGNIASNSADGTSTSYALVFADNLLEDGELGAALFKRTQPVWISLQNVQAASGTHSFPADVLLSQVVAHESGHKFDLDHPSRIAHHGEHDLFTLPLDMYTRSAFDARQLYVRYGVYLHEGQAEVGEK